MPSVWNDTYVVLDANGNVTFNFSGIIHAAGLNLDAATNTTPPDQDQIRWLRTTDGAVVAHLDSYYSANQAALELTADFPAGATSALTRITAPGVSLQVQQNASGRRQAIANALGSVVQIWDDLKQSDFLRLGATKSMQFVAGRITTATATLNAQTGGITGVIRNAAGNVTITHIGWPGGGNAVACVGVANTPGLQVAQIGLANTATNLVAVTGAGVNTDCVMEFILLGGA